MTQLPGFQSLNNVLHLFFLLFQKINDNHGTSVTMQRYNRVQHGVVGHPTTPYLPKQKYAAFCIPLSYPTVTPPVMMSFIFPRISNLQSEQILYIDCVALKQDNCFFPSDYRAFFSCIPLIQMSYVAFFRGLHNRGGGMGKAWLSETTCAGRQALTRPCPFSELAALDGAVQQPVWRQEAFVGSNRTMVLIQLIFFSWQCHELGTPIGGG